jgi:hypothetical protein
VIDPGSKPVIFGVKMIVMVQLLPGVIENAQLSLSA